MTAPGERLEQALSLWLRLREGDDRSREQVLADHPELRDLLAPLFGVTEDGGEVSPEPLTDEVGRTLGDYRLLRELGRGGMGRVFEARQLSLGRLVAVKLLRDDMAGDPARLARFQREAKVLAKLTHSGIVRVLEVGEAVGQHFFAMELVIGESLEQRLAWLRENGGHEGGSLRAMVEITAQVADALHHAHDAGLVHRDIKPSNVLLRQDGRAVLGDFGLARETTLPTLTVAGSLAGTPDYMAPEQVTRGLEACDARSDVFSLGAMLYEAITLTRPFEGPTLVATLERVTRREPLDPRRLNRAVAPDLAAIVLRALEKDPRRRYPTAAAFAADLRAFLELRPVTARPASTLGRLRRWCRREPLRAAFAAVLLLSVPAITGLGGYVLANADDVAAARRARDDRQIEELSTTGFLANLAHHRQLALASFEQALAIRADDPETIVGATLARSKFDGPQAAMTWLHQHAPEPRASDLRYLEALLLQRLDRTAEADALRQRLGPPTSPLALQIAGTAALLDFDKDPSAAQRALPLLSLASRVTPQPRAMYAVQWASCANAARDRAAMKESADTLTSLWPDRAFAWQLAAANVQYDDPALALTYQRKAMALGAADGLAYGNLAAYLFKNGQLQPAIEAAAVSVQRDPDDDRFWTIRLALVAKLGELQPVEDVAATWLAAKPDDPVANREIAGVLLRIDPARALPHARAATEKAPDDAGAWMCLAAAYDHADRLADALAAVRRAQQVQPLLEGAHLHALSLLDALHDDAGVIAEDRRWAELRPTDPRAWTDLARAMVERGGVDPAAAVSAALRADYLAGGKDAVVLALVARAYDQAGNAAAAALYRARQAGTTAAGG